MNATIKTPILAAALVATLLAAGSCAHASDCPVTAQLIGTDATGVRIYRLPTVLVTRSSAAPTPAPAASQASVTIHRLPTVVISGSRERPVLLAGQLRARR